MKWGSLFFADEMKSSCCSDLSNRAKVQRWVRLLGDIFFSVAAQITQWKKRRCGGGGRGGGWSWGGGGVAEQDAYVARGLTTSQTAIFTMQNLRHCCKCTLHCSKIIRQRALMAPAEIHLSWGIPQAFTDRR